MANWSGIAASVQSLIKPSILQPRLQVPSIAQLDWAAFKGRGITGVILDKDNCITKPHVDTIEPSLQPAWDDLLKTFGPANVLVVSNSAGTGKDSLLLQAESVSRRLLVPVLVHPTPKPGPACVKAATSYFLSPSSSSGNIVWSPRGRSLARPLLLAPSAASSTTPRPRPRILVIGDRLATDMILAHRIRAGGKVDAVPVLTTKLHAREGLGTTFLRTIERLALWSLERKTKAGGRVLEGDWEACLVDKAVAIPTPALKPPNMSAGVSSSPTPTSGNILDRLQHRLLQPFVTFSLPRFLASLHAPLSRITALWTPPPAPSIVDAPSPRWTSPTNQWKQMFSSQEGAVGVAQRAVEESEKVVGELRRRVREVKL